LQTSTSVGSIKSNSSPPRWAANSSASHTLHEKLNPRSVATNTDFIPNPGVRHRTAASRDYHQRNGIEGEGTLVDSLREKNLQSDVGHKTIYVDTNPDGWDTIDDGRIEADDYLHDPHQELPEKPATFSLRAVLNMGALFIVIGGILTLFAGYPLIAHFDRKAISTNGGFNLGGSNASGQIAQLPASMRAGLVDVDTPDNVKTRTGFDGEQYTLVFSDEFNTDGRSFYPGDDPFWEASDLHYWATNNYEWYDPAAITTSGGQLAITLSQTPEHNLNFRGGMLQSWNKFCFTGGYIEASVQLPGTATVSGLWPAFWTMGNLGRAGYGATLEGAWPYSYNQCDVGTLQNQTTVAGLPVESQTGGNSVFNRKHNTDALSFLGGQRMSACTCPADYPELHPGPLLPDGTLQGRGAPEIDIFEAQVNTGTDRIQVSQSAQWAPFNMNYTASNTTGPAYTIYQTTSKHNSYTGEITQQSASVVTDADQDAIQVGGANTFATYGFEYQPGTDGYVQWVSAGEPSWKLNPAFLDADIRAQIGQREMAAEPMYIIFNLGISKNFASPDWTALEEYWPAVMKVDYVRVYQRSDSINVGCDPPDYPTADFINRHKEAYTNQNMTTWGGSSATGGYGANWPRNNLNPQACNAPLSTSAGSPVTAKAKAPILPTYDIGNDD
jgi:beta-glucanase (GH16 family)